MQIFSTPQFLTSFSLLSLFWYLTYMQFSSIFSIFSPSLFFSLVFNIYPVLLNSYLTPFSTDSTVIYIFLSTDYRFLPSHFPSKGQNYNFLVYISKNSSSLPTFLWCSLRWAECRLYKCVYTIYCSFFCLFVCQLCSCLYECMDMCVEFSFPFYNFTILCL